MDLGVRDADIGGVRFSTSRIVRNPPLAYLQVLIYTPLGNQMGNAEQEKSDVLRGTLVLMVLRTLSVLGPLHGYAIGGRIQQISANLLNLNQGTLYPALLQMEQEGWIAGKWGTSENNRRAKFYSITAAGKRQLAKETGEWKRMTSTIERFLGPLTDMFEKEVS